MKNIRIRQRSRQLFLFFRDPEYYFQLFQIAAPIALQNFVMASLNMVGVILVGQLGSTSVAAVGLANQIFFLLNLLLFGITSGSAMFTAQLWGKRDLANIHKVLGLAVSMSLAAGLVFFTIAVFFPEQALRIYSNDPEVIRLGSQYLRIIGWSCLFSAVTTSYAAILRSVGEIKIPLMVNISALALNTLLSYILIFGLFGLPALGVRGVGVGGLIARILETSALLWVTYARRTPAAASLRELFNLDLSFAWKVLKPVLPVALNELLWSLGVTTYNIAYAHISTDAVAAMNIVSTVDTMSFGFFNGISNACAILVGNRIGAGDEDEAQIYAARSLSLGFLGGLVVGGLVFFVSPLILTVYKVDAEVIRDAQMVLRIVGCVLWLRAMNMILFIGVFRSGGDTRFALLLDGVIIWLTGVPLALTGALLLHLPVYWVYLLVMSEEITKWTLGIFRFISKKWIHNLAKTV